MSLKHKFYLKYKTKQIYKKEDKINIRLMLSFTNSRWFCDFLLKPCQNHSDTLILPMYMWQIINLKKSNAAC